MPKVRVLSAVPRQLNDEDKKLSWIKQQIDEHRPDVLVTPQEFFGGASMMLHQKSFTFTELFPKLSKIAKRRKCAIVVGVQENRGGVADRESIWFIDEVGEMQGYVDKFALPKYDHLSTNGYGNVEPETNLENRFKTFKIQGLNVSAIFCWEAFSNLLWTGLAILKPDVVFSMIKFGANSWPKVSIDKKTGLNTINGFGYGKWHDPIQNEVWISRLYAASLWQVQCPIICSTNSWNLRPISLPLCGCIAPIPGQAEDTLWAPDRSMKSIPEKISIDIINKDRIQSVLESKFKYKELVGDWPPFSIGEYTMLLKISRIERRIASGREAKTVAKTISKIKGGFEL